MTPNKALLAGICLLFCINVECLELRVYPSDFKHFSGSELRWPVGNSLELSCELEGQDSDQYALVWYLPHVQGRSTNLTHQNGRSTLYMSQINSEDTGPYKCKAEKLNVNSNLPLIKDKTLTLYVVSTSDVEKCSQGFFQCEKNHRHCIGKRYLCDGFKDCPDGSDETSQLCGQEDWCEGKLRCGDEARCIDPAQCCDPQLDPSCKILMECCEPYVKSNRYFFQLGIEQSAKNHRQKHGQQSGHIIVVIGGIIAFTCVLFVIIILMCQFPTEKPWLRPPNFLNRGRWPRNQHGNQNNLPVTMEDLDIYFESLRNVTRSDENPLPPPYILASEPPPPYPDSPRSVRIESNNAEEDNNNGDINGNSDLRDQHSERILRPISPPTSRRPIRAGGSLVALHHFPQNQHRMRESRSYAALMISPSRSYRIRGRQDSSSSDSD